MIFAVIPTTAFKDTADFFHKELPNAGYKVVYFEADPPRDSEGAYQGKGVAGRWRLHAIAGCPKGIAMQAAAQPVK